ncbi:hypothetical protein HMPREF0541_01357 [Lacticaseibacillus rhamnosus ATCC 21052]|nr:hypothetical protein HMPREF0541_01357 [Lacticaseibacillus rhamnosus ATCC 21052]
MARNLRVRTLGAMAKPTITPKATYTPTSERAGSRSALDKMFALFIKSGTMKMYQLIR